MSPTSCRCSTAPLDYTRGGLRATGGGQHCERRQLWPSDRGRLAREVDGTMSGLVSPRPVADTTGEISHALARKKAASASSPSREQNGRLLNHPVPLLLETNERSREPPSRARQLRLIGLTALTPPQGRAGLPSLAGAQRRPRRAPGRCRYTSTCR